MLDPALQGFQIFGRDFRAPGFIEAARLCRHERMRDARNGHDLVMLIFSLLQGRFLAGTGQQGEEYYHCRFRFQISFSFHRGCGFILDVFRIIAGVETPHRGRLYERGSFSSKCICPRVTAPVTGGDSRPLRTSVRGP